MTQTPPLFVTNFNKNFTGVSATAAGVVKAQAKEMDLRLVGYPLPDCPDPIDLKTARAMSRTAPQGYPFAIWHVRRNPEMRAAIWARDVLRLPIRIVFTSAAQRRHSAFPRWLISRMDAVIATTDAAADYVPHVRAVVPHGVDTDRFHPADDRAAAWAATGFPGKRGIATVGRIRPEKGTDQFVDAMIRVLPNHPATTALVIGRAGGSHEAFLSELKTRVAGAGLAERILFCGEIEPEKLPALLRGLSLLVPLPRYEGYGMTPLEAMASGVPFVATDTGYFRAFSMQGEAGQVVPLGDVEGAAARIQSLLTGDGQLDAMSRRAVEVARNSYGIQTEVDGIISVYQQLWSEAAHR
ncbi:glycosyltransferase family 4 protein [Litoreibacter arenae]|uniref:Lipopolysaccharide core biosynthesis mannosyltransferase lpcC n=1 Tax=Litoreibacter arenae DSM 19593 TaxID=1123360 RepID=S9RHD7_9RHOB|nr:glycosyltransferase family 4 protein [Litoreibacter arenae]EPX77500.1 Lipopolysaccharide core biosynthesis mannosyltransferase lpcC [Litoreibacter arenae DSM 19593]